MARRKPGRPRGAGNKIFGESKDLLFENRVLLLQQALLLATRKKSPNTRVLCKLLDKLFPTLTSSRVQFPGQGAGFKDLTEEEARKMAVEYARLLPAEQSEENKE